MLRNVVRSFLESLTEREFDAPLLAVLFARGFTDIHFLHGAFEFGKDVIAKRRSDDGVVRQYAIQSKGGDLGAGEWRSVRTQLDECFHNDIAHPGFDATLPRVGVLVTTGRLKGAASADAQQYRKAIERRGLGDLEVWDVDGLTEWMSVDPALGIAGAGEAAALMDLVLSVQRRAVSEPVLERHTRSWVSGESPASAPRACLEAAIVCSALRTARRLDLAALVALHLLRAAWTPESDESDAGVAAVAVDLFETYATELLGQVEPLLGDSRDLLRPVADVMSIVTYPALVCRLTELLSLLGLGVADPEVRARASRALLRLCADHPGSRRPPSDQFAASLVPTTVLLARVDRPAARTYLRDVASWLIDRHDPEHDGLGLSSMDESGEDAAARLLGGSLTFVTSSRRRSSYLATVLLDLLLALGEESLYTAVLENFTTLRVVPIIAAADERRARWRRGGVGVLPHPRVDYAAFAGPPPAHHARASGTPPLIGIMLAATARNRHEPKTIERLLSEVGSEGIAPAPTDQADG